MLGPCWVIWGISGAPWKSLAGRKNLQQTNLLLMVFLMAVWPMLGPCGAHVVGPMLGYLRGRLFGSHVKQFIYV